MNFVQNNIATFDTNSSLSLSEHDEECCQQSQKQSNLKCKEYFVTIDIDNMSDESREPISDSDDSDEDNEDMTNEEVILRPII